jgi:hypothetical protein
VDGKTSFRLVTIIPETLLGALRVAGHNLRLAHEYCQQ